MTHSAVNRERSGTIDSDYGGKKLLSPSSQTRNKLVWAIIAANGCVLWSTASPATTITDLSKKARQSIVYITVNGLDEDGKETKEETGTGFLISEQGHVITARHVLEYEKGKLRLNMSIKGEIGGKGSPFPDLSFDHVSKRNKLPRDADLALLKAEGGSQISMRPVSVCDHMPSEGAGLIAFGFPLGKGFQPTPVTLGDPSAWADHWQASANFTYGMSGGPVYDMSGNVRGVVKGGDSKTVGALNLITPIEYASPWLKKTPKSCIEILSHVVDVKEFSGPAISEARHKYIEKGADLLLTELRISNDTDARFSLDFRKHKFGPSIEASATGTPAPAGTRNGRTPPKDAVYELSTLYGYQGSRLYINSQLDHRETGTGAAANEMVGEFEEKPFRSLASKLIKEFGCSVLKYRCEQFNIRIGRIDCGPEEFLAICNKLTRWAPDLLPHALPKDLRDISILSEQESHLKSQATLHVKYWVISPTEVNVRLSLEYGAGGKQEKVPDIGGTYPEKELSGPARYLHLLENMDLTNVAIRAAQLAVNEESSSVN